MHNKEAMDNNGLIESRDIHMRGLPPSARGIVHHHYTHGGSSKFKRCRGKRHNNNNNNSSKQSPMDCDSSELKFELNQEEESCPGDTESSDSETERTQRKTKELEASILHNKKHDGPSDACSAVTLKDRLSLAEKQLDNNETEGLICLTCL